MEAETLYPRDNFGFAVRFAELSDANRGRIERTIGCSWPDRAARAAGGRSANREEGQVPLKNDGSRMSRIVRSPGGAVSTAGIELTVIDAVAISPCTPPAILE